MHQRDAEARLVGEHVFLAGKSSEKAWTDPSNNTAECMTFDALLDTLRPRLLSGKIRVGASRTIGAG